MIRLVSKNRKWGSISIGNALRYFFGLASSVGFIVATKVSLQTLSRLLGAEGFRLSLSRSTSEPLMIPVGPPGWRSGIQELLEAAEKTRNDDALNVDLRSVVDQASASRNDPSRARVAILIPTYEHVEQALQCIKSLFAWKSQVNFRIHVGDDSRERTMASLASIPGVDLTKNETSLGFLRNVQTLADKESTDYLLILNQDTLALPGLIDNLVHYMDEHLTVGIAAPVVLDSDLNVLEIGGEINDSGVARHRFRGIPSSDFQHLYTQSVDYVSGCAMFVRSSLWRELEGFDDQFSPGYYEDADLCLRAHAMGHDVKVVSSTFVIHLEGTSHGKFPQDHRSTKQFQHENESAFKNKLSLEKVTIGQQVEPRSSNPAGELVLVFDSIPDPQRDGGSADADNFVRHALSLGYRVTAATLDSPSAAQTFNWRSLGVRCLPDISELVSTLHKLSSATLVTFGLPSGQYAASLKLPTSVRWIHYSLDVFTRRLETLLNVQNLNDPNTQVRWNLGLPREPELMWKIESEVLARAHLVLYASEQDHEFVTARSNLRNGKTFQVLKGDHYVGNTKPPPNQNIGLVGSLTHQPNIDALEYCLSEIWPAIHHASPDARLLVWGSGTPEFVVKLCNSTPGVEFRGWFRDWQQVASSVRFVISPLRYGAGAKNRTVSAILAGRPVIGSSISFDGLPRSPDSHSYLADNADDYVRLSRQLLGSDLIWREMITRQRQLTEGTFTSFYERELVARVLSRFS